MCYVKHQGLVAWWLQGRPPAVGSQARIGERVTICLSCYYEIGNLNGMGERGHEVMCRWCQ